MCPNYTVYIEIIGHIHEIVNTYPSNIPSIRSSYVKCHAMGLPVFSRCTCNGICRVRSGLSAKCGHFTTSAVIFCGDFFLCHEVTAHLTSRSHIFSKTQIYQEILSIRSIYNRLKRLQRNWRKYRLNHDRKVNIIMVKRFID